MSAGERLATLAGPTAVLGIQPQQAPQTVYNLEIQGQHVFRVTGNGLLVHNSYGPRGVANMGEFIKGGFGRNLSGVAQKTPARFQGQSIFKTRKKLGDNIKKGDHFYLDNKHKDHLEVFDINGTFKFVLNLDGTINNLKTKAALGRSIRDLLK